MRPLIAAAVLVPALLAGCSTPPKVAQAKTVELGGRKLEFGGTYQPRETALSLTINGDPVMNGRFPPYTPTLNLNTQYQGMAVRAECYFSSVLSSRGGVVGIVSGAVQSAHNKTSDKCDMVVNGKTVESLYF